MLAILIYGICTVHKNNNNDELPLGVPVECGHKPFFAVNINTNHQAAF